MRAYTIYFVGPHVGKVSLIGCALPPSSWESAAPLGGGPRPLPSCGAMREVPIMRAALIGSAGESSGGFPEVAKCWSAKGLKCPSAEVLAKALKWQSGEVLKC